MALHSFNEDVAAKVGVNAAILYQNILFWCEKNKGEKSEKHYHEGRYWTFNSYPQFASYFKYLSPKQVRTALELLVQEGYILAGNFNDKLYDNTKWYTLAPAPQGNTPAPQGRPSAPQGRPIPDSKPDIKPNTNTSSKDDGDMDLFNRVFWSKYPKKVGKKAAFKSFKAVMKQVDRGDVHYGEFMTAFEKYVDSMKGKDTQFVKHLSTWLNGEHWTDEV